MALDLSMTCSGGGQYLQKAENKSMSQISHAGELVLIQAQPDGPQPEKRKNSREPFWKDLLLQNSSQSRD